MAQVLETCNTCGKYFVTKSHRFMLALLTSPCLLSNPQTGRFALHSPTSCCVSETVTVEDTPNQSFVRMYGALRLLRIRNKRPVVTETALKMRLRAH